MGKSSLFNAFVNRLHDVVCFDEPDRVAIAELPNEALDHVVVRREIAAFHDDNPPVRLKLQCRRHNLVQVNTGRIGQHDLVWLCADQRRDLSTKCLRQLVPPCRIHAADQPLGPLLLDHLPRTLRGFQGHGAERVAVEINHALRQEEFVPERR